MAIYFRAQVGLQRPYLYFTWPAVNVQVGFQFESYTVREDEERVTIVIEVESVNNEDTEREVEILLSYSSTGAQNPGLCACSYSN